MFKLTKGSGFHMSFENGYTISVQFGPGSYSDNRNSDIGWLDIDTKSEPSTTAEIAIFNPKGEMYRFEDGDSVKGWCKAEEVAEWIWKVSLASPGIAGF